MFATKTDDDQNRRRLNEFKPGQPLDGSKTHVHSLSIIESFIRDLSIIAAPIFSRFKKGKTIERLIPIDSGQLHYRKTRTTSLFKGQRFKSSSHVSQ